MEDFITNSAKETEKLGEKLAKELLSRIFALTGELGSGKTTFVKGFARGLGIKKRIISPSFVFIRQYKITPPRSRFATPRRSELRAKGTPRMVTRRGSSEVKELASEEWRDLYHIDLYRLEKPSDVKGLGLEEIWSNPYNIVIIEWAEKIERILPKEKIEINFEYLGKNQRKITIK